MRCVTSRVRPVRGSKRATRSWALSTTRRIPSMVKLVSAILVASTTLRFPAGAGRIALRCSLKGNAPYSGQRMTSSRHALRQLFQNALDLADAGQKQQHRSLFMPQELRRRYRHRLIKTLVRGERAEATLHRISAPSETTTGASGSRRCRRSLSRVADMISSLRSSRNPCWTSSSRARARSACRLRS
ncbi:Uncharacterised protein [Klebsiella pneumoniae subsp. rhinoscleromatis]|nr:Uncharacterised protein [Klebsiella pneumoniae subsp. rhinoscleromatis]